MKMPRNLCSGTLATSASVAAYFVICDRNTSQMQVPRNVISPTPPDHTISWPKHTLRNIKAYESKKWQPFWGGESADSRKQQVRIFIYWPIRKYMYIYIYM